jgi:hypothetical protein
VSSCDPINGHNLVRNYVVLTDISAYPSLVVGQEVGRRGICGGQVPFDY